MEKRTLGNTNIQLAPLVFGGNVFGWTADEPTSFQLLDAFTDAGLNGIDTADLYTAWISGNTGGESETLIGKWLKKSGKRDKVVIASKVGGKFNEERKGLKKAYILQSVEESLTRLQTDYIDLYQTHYDDPETPIEETLEAYAEIVKSGKVLAIGTSNMTVERLAESITISQQKGFSAYQSLQPEYNLMEREKYETQYAPFVKEHNIGVIPYFALASGFLTGKYRSEKDLEGSSRTKYVGRYINERGFKILKALDEVAAQYNSKPGIVAIAWLIAQPGITAPIASATSIAQLDDLVAAVALKPDAAALELLNTASAY